METSRGGQINEIAEIAEIALKQGLLTTQSGDALDFPKRKFFIAVAGNIGTGKTTLATMLSQHFSWDVHCEAVIDNPYLADFYKDMKRWSFPLQIFFLNSRLRSHRKILSLSTTAIQDRSVYEDAHIFARNLFENGEMEKRDYENYIELYNFMVSHLPPPDLIVYLKKSLPRLKSQIQKRGRDYEKDIPDHYLANLSRYYDDWMDRYDLGNKLLIESDDLDFVTNAADFRYIAELITKNLGFSEGFTVAARSDQIHPI